MRCFFTVAMLFLELLRCGAQVEVMRQHDMKKWGVPPGNYSGITHIEGNRYALISDKQSANGWQEVTIDFKPSGDIKKMTFVGRHYDNTKKGTRDAEGIVYAGEGLFFVSAEDDQHIIELDSEGMATGKELRIPECFKREKTFGNCGFEALAYDASQKVFWTTTEQGLRKDVEKMTSPSFPHPTLLRIQSFGEDLEPLEQYAYKTDAPRTRRRDRYYGFGVPEMTVVDDSTLLVMERELTVPQHYEGSKCYIKIFRLDPREMKPLCSEASLRDIPDSMFVTKSLLTEFKTGINLLGRKNYANYEGMCLGPLNAKGRRTLLLVADSQDRKGNGIFCLKDYIRVIVF